FDAIRTTLDYAPYTIDMIYAKTEENATNLRDDRSLAGVNVAYDWASYNGLTEGYFFYEQGTDDEQASEEDEDNIWVIGARAQMDPNDKWTLGAEGAFQGGKDASGSTNREAWAGIANAEYRFLNDYNAKLGLKFAYLSGNDDSADSDTNAWDPMFEDQTPAEIINILFANTNMMYTNLSGSMMPREDITLGLNWTWAKLAENIESLTVPTASSQIVGNSYSIDRDETTIGNEIDAYACYDYTEDVQIKLTGGWFIPGDFFASANDDMAYSLRAGINVDF
ncbi:MAG: alginate export family protein, partial [Candidatus Omnitrophica bacterium]|nr:alginate export family protein [Candidatus Omnitrophota bacterium]